MREIIFKWYGADGSAHYRRDQLPDSAVMKIGEDKAGREVFENDTLVDEFGNEWVAGYVVVPIEKMEKVCDHISADAPKNRKEVWK